MSYFKSMYEDCEREVKTIIKGGMDSTELMKLCIMERAMENTSPGGDLSDIADAIRNIESHDTRDELSDIASKLDKLDADISSKLDELDGITKSIDDIYYMMKK